MSTIPTLVSMLKLSIDSLSGIGSAAVLRERIDLLKQQMELIEKAHEEAEKKISEQTQKIQDLEQELATYRIAEQFTEHRGALFKRKADGRYAHAVYCPKCRSSVGSIDPDMPYYCGACRWTSAFMSGGLDGVLAEIA